MKRVTFDDMDCSIARTLDVVGEWWTPLIVREVFFGRRRFDEIQSDLGIARNVLTARLNRLVDEGILYRHDIGERGQRYEYRLTEQGAELFPVLVALMNWGDKWRRNPKGAPTELVHESCGERTTPTLCCSECGEELTSRDVRAQPGRRWKKDDTHPLVRAARTAR